MAAQALLFCPSYRRSYARAKVALDALAVRPTEGVAQTWGERDGSTHPKSVYFTDKGVSFSFCSRELIRAQS